MSVPPKIVLDQAAEEVIPGWFEEFTHLFMRGGVGVKASADAGLILVVEDDYGLCDLVATVLELDPTIRTACAVDGEHALEMVRAMRPSLVILDTRPLKLGGLEVARQLKADPTTQVIPLVGLTSGPLSESAPADACDYHITRPYDLVDLVQKLRRPLGLDQEPSVAA